MLIKGWGLFQLLKLRTKEVLYEKYRTEKLLARRATKNISEDETKRLLEGNVPSTCCGLVDSIEQRF